MVNTILTDDEIKAECRVGLGIDPVLDGNMMRFARAIEAAVLAKLRDEEPEHFFYKAGWDAAKAAAPQPAVVPQEMRQEILKAKALADRHSKIDRHKVFGRILEKYLDAILAAPEAPATAVVQVPPPREYHKAFPLDVQFSKGWNACRDAMLAAAPEAPAQLPQGECFTNSNICARCGHPEFTEAPALPAVVREAIKVARALLRQSRPYVQSDLLLTELGSQSQSDIFKAADLLRSIDAAIARIDALGGVE